jgi:tetratricopeptide (TPR) repeat protein
LSIEPAKGSALVFTAGVHATDRLGEDGAVAGPVRVAKDALDKDGPSSVANAIARALAQHWSLPKLTNEAEAAPARTTPFQAFELYSDAVEYCRTGRYDVCEIRAREAVAMDPQSSLFRSLLGCAYSFQGKDELADTEIKQSIDLMGQLTSRRERLMVEQDKLFVAASAAKSRHDTAALQSAAKKAIEIGLDLTRSYGEPVGILYAAINYQYLLEDIPAARKLYAEARRFAPMLYPPYYEDAKLLRSQGGENERKEAGRLLWTFIQCNPQSKLVRYARADADAWGLAAPTEQLRCDVDAK